MASSGNKGLTKILELVEAQSNALQSAKQSHNASKQAYDSTGYYPDPMVKFNYFVSPIETRNGPQRSNLMVSQVIPWPSSLQADEDVAAKMIIVKAEQVEVLRLELIFNVKSMIYKYIEINEKIETKKKMIITLNNLSQVVLGRLKLGSANQAELSRISIEVAKLTQAIKKLETRKVSIQGKLKSLTGGASVDHLLPTSFDPAWGKLSGFNPSGINLKEHPYIKLFSAKVGASGAEIERKKSRRLPKIQASASWFQIDEPNSEMMGLDAGKDAWALGASISVPIWSSKYDSSEYSAVSKQKAAQLDLKQKELDLQYEIDNSYEEYLSTSEISGIFANDILPQANQALKADRESYSQGAAPFERIITSYIRVIKFEDQLIENQVKQAVLKASLERLVGRNL